MLIASGETCIYLTRNYPSRMIRIKKTRPIKLRRSTAFTRFLGSPAVRYSIAGFLSIFISFMLLLFMMYITHSFTNGSSMASQILFDLETVKLQKQDQQRRVRVQRPPGIDDIEEPPALEQTQD